MSQDKAAEVINLVASRDAALSGPGGESAGLFLANARQEAGLSLAEISAATKVKISHLEAIENMRPDLLPATAYAVGFVKVYARHLGLDSEALAARFREDVNATAPAPIEPARMPPPQDSGVLGEGVKMASIFGIIAVVIFAIWITFQITGGGDASQRADAERAPTARVRVGEAPAPRPTLRQTTPLVEDQTDIENAAPADDAAETPVDTAEAGDQPQEETAPAVAEEETQGAEATPANETVAEAEAAPALQQPVAETPAPAAPVTAPVEELAAEPEREEIPLRQGPPIRQEVIVPAEPIRTTAPDYPSRCQAGANELETVTVMFDVTAAGRAANIRVINSTNDCFDDEAVRTIGRWSFNPRTVDGSPRPDVGKKATVNFRR